MLPIKLRTIALPLVLLPLLLIGCSSNNGDNTEPTDPTDPTDSSDSTDSSETLTAQLQQLADNAVVTGLPGVSIASDAGEGSQPVVAGVAYRESGELLTTQSRFPIASSGKPFTAALLLRLVQEGLIGLDDPIELWLPDTVKDILSQNNNLAAITTGMLLSHTSGVPGYLSNEEYFDSWYTRRGEIWTPEETLQFISQSPQDFEPGANFKYSNSNYLLAGVIVEQVTGMTLSAALRQWILNPAQLSHTFHADEVAGQQPMVQGYLDASAIDFIPFDGDLKTFDWVNAHGFGDAPLQSTSEDLNLFMRVLVTTDVILNAEFRAKMLTEQFPGSQYGFGMGIGVDDNGFPFYFHPGSHFGYSSQMLYLPEADLAIAALVNGSSGRFEAPYQEFLNGLSDVIINNVGR